MGALLPGGPEIDESELVSLLNDPALSAPGSDPQLSIMAVAVLGNSYGDDEHAAALLRWRLNRSDTNGEFQGECLIALVKRVGDDALPDLRVVWSGKRPRAAREAALGGLGFLGVCDYWEDVLQLYERALKRGQWSSGGVETGNLLDYLLACSARLEEVATRAKELIRSQWIEVEPALKTRLRTIFPGIDEPPRQTNSVEVDTVEALGLFSKFKRLSER
jgi:hypothetical protein